MNKPYYNFLSMKYLLAFCLLFIGYFTSLAQQTSKQLQDSAKTLLQQGNFDRAVVLLDRARRAEPDNIEILKDISFANYLKRDFAQAIEIGKGIVERPDADQQSFQVLGLSYKAIASYKEAAKLYKTALKKFPNSGVIYNEYGESLAMDNNIADAIIQWEKGIEVDPGYSSNYYNATTYYMKSKQWLRAMIYAETFLNLESYSARTEEIKKQLPLAYKDLLTAGGVNSFLDGKKITAFETGILESLATAADGTTDMNIDNIMVIRTRFIKDWVKTKQKLYPFRLFDNQQYLLDQGLFDAYNYWLLSDAVNPDTYKSWLAGHSKESEAFNTFQQNRVFKIPMGQYYFSR
jgi:tetratricopeptide (TPR) repeat protein